MPLASLIDADHTFDSPAEVRPDTLLIDRMRALSTRPRRLGDAERIRSLIAVGALTDAALSLIEIELPRWRLRRLIYEDGEWHCFVSRQRDMPDWLDDAAEGHHADMSSAILEALDAAKLEDDARPKASVPDTTSSALDLVETALCENFR